MLKNSFLTVKKLKVQLVLTASVRTICRYLNILGWRKVNTKYCQIVSPVNRVKRFIFCCMAKLQNERFDDVIDIDECTVELRQCTYKTWNKPSANLLRAHGGKVGKPKHNLKVHLFGGISRKGLTPLVIFTGIMYSKDFQKFLSQSIIPFIAQRFPYRHRFFMDNDPKHTSHSTRRFMILNNINHCPTPPQSPVISLHNYLVM